MNSLLRQKMLQFAPIFTRNIRTNSYYKPDKRIMYVTEPVHRSTILFASQYKIDELRVKKENDTLNSSNTNSEMISDNSDNGSNDSNNGRSFEEEEDLYYTKMSIEYATNGTYTVNNEGNVVIVENK